MSFAAPLVLLALLVLPALLVLYLAEQRRRREAQHAFVTPRLTDSAIPHRPGWRRHVPLLVLAIALAVLILAAARPQRSVAVPVTSATIMLVNDISDSMSATDVSPTRLGAAQRAARTLVEALPPSVRVGQIAFARHPILLQSPSTNHALTEQAIARLRSGGGGTAMGEAIQTALAAIEGVPKINGRRPAGAIVLLSDGASNVGISPVQAAQQAKVHHVRIDTVALGTAAGTIPGRGGRSVPVPVSAQELAQVAATAGGRTFTAADAATARAIYARLATVLGRRHVHRPMTAGFAGAGLVLLLLSTGLTLYWFARIA